MKKNIIFFIMGALTFGSGVLGASYMYNAKEVSYKDTTVEAAVENLYSTESSLSNSITDINNQMSSLNTQTTGINTQITGINTQLTSLNASDRGKRISVYDNYILSAFNGYGVNYGSPTLTSITVGGPALSILYSKHSDSVGGCVIAFGYVLPRPVYYYIRNKQIVSEYYL